MKKSLGWAYLFFALSLVGLAGLHTIYLGKPRKGVFFLLATWAGLWALTQVLILPSPSIPIVIGLALPRLWQNFVFTIPSPSLPLVVGLLALPVIGVWWWVDLFSLPRQTRKANGKIAGTPR